MNDQASPPVNDQADRPSARTDGGDDQPVVELKRQYVVGLVIVLVASVSGYFLALRRTPEAARRAELAATRVEREVQAEQSPTRESPTDELPTAETLTHKTPRPAPSYLEMSADKFGPNQDFRPELAGLKPLELNYQQLVELRQDFRSPTPEEREAMRRRRAERRAFSGAPPTVPHPIHERDSRNCLVCHEHTVRIGDKVSPAMSHQMLGQCTQCHVETSGSPPLFASQAGSAAPADGPAHQATNHFRGMLPALQGHRANRFAPPTIPHPTWMRSACVSCHHPAGSSPLRTSHPWRQSCAQCHAPSAEYDQFPQSAAVTTP